jgi:hypothetical protein
MHFWQGKIRHSTEITLAAVPPLVILRARARQSSGHHRFTPTRYSSHLLLLFPRSCSIRRRLSAQ